MQRSSLYLTTTYLVATALSGNTVQGWVIHPSTMMAPPSLNQPSHPHELQNRLRQTRLFESAGDEEDESAPTDFTGKTLFQRTFYRLTPSARVAQPNAVVVEERIRFQANPADTTNVQPMGPVTYVLREGTEEDEITDEIVRLDATGIVGGSATSESTIAAILFLASNPQICQGNMLQIASGSGIATILGCIGAGYALEDKEAYKAAKKLKKQQLQKEAEAASSETDSAGEAPAEPVPLVKKGDRLFPPRLTHLTLSDETPSSLQQAFQTVKNARLTPGKVTIVEKVWSQRPAAMSAMARRNGSMDGAYRAVIGCDIPYAFPSAKALARCVAHALLPSDVVAQSQVESGASRAGQAGGGMGGGFLGMDDGPSSPPSASTPKQSSDDPAAEIDPAVPPAFVHIASERSLDSSEDSIYLRQFLEQGYRMDVSTNYFKVERLSFHYQTLDTISPTLADEDELDNMDLELVDEATPSYQSLIAIHHPDYAGDGSGELFFPMETGAYQGGSRGASTYLEPETEGGSFLM